MAPSSTASRTRRFPWALCSALLLLAAAGVFVGRSAENIATSDVLFYLVKFRWAREGVPSEVVVLGASQSVASIQPGVIEAALPSGTRVLNFGIPALAPSGGAALLRTYLESGDAPALVVVAYNPLIYTERTGEFEKYAIPHALGARDVLRAARIDGSLYYPLAWLASRSSLVRYRAGIQTWLQSLALDAAPSFESRMREWLDVPDTPGGLYRFRWEYTARRERNADLVAELDQSRGWHYWREAAHEGRLRRLAEGAEAPRSGFVQRRAATPQTVGPFVASLRETDAVLRLIAMCRERGVLVQLVSAPSAPWLAELLRSDGGEARLHSFWQEIGAGPGVRSIDSPLVVYSQRDFSDPTHLGPRGARRYSEELAPIVAAAYAEALRRRVDVSTGRGSG